MMIMIINLIKLKLLEEKLDLNLYFGNWINNIDELSKKFINDDPFNYIKIDNFLNLNYAEKLYNEYPNDFSNWHKYWNPLEVKYANDDINNMNINLRKLFYLLSTNGFTKFMSKLSSILDLEVDPYLNGAGLHVHPRYGRLHLHLDYEKHPKLINKQRRLNIILFLTKDWKQEWNGDNQLWNKDITKCIVRSYPKFNSAIIFQTNEISWHGLPDVIQCPENVYRKSFAYYYISPLSSSSQSNKIGNDGSGYRTKAIFTKKPDDPNLEQMTELYKIRPIRRIENDDLKKIWPEWTPNLF